MTDDVLQVRHVLARWRANDWRRAFALAGGLDGSLRAACDVPGHEPLTDNTGALAMPLLRRLGELDLPALVRALQPLLEELARDPADLTPGLAELRDCGLAPVADVTAVVAVLEEAQAQAVTAARQVLADVEAGRPADLSALQAWNDGLGRAGADLPVLRTASLAAEAQALLADAVETGDPQALRAVQELLADR